jgi:VPDSG-CTERM motif
MLSEANPGCGITIALLLLMKTNLVSVRKVALLAAAVCTVMLASVSQVRADRHPLPPTSVSVPDAGATVMLLGVALGALGMARRFIRKP